MHVKNAYFHISFIQNSLRVSRCILTAVLYIIICTLLCVCTPYPPLYAQRGERGNNRIDTLRADPSTDRTFNGQNGFRSDTRFLIMNHSNETNIKVMCSIRQNQYQNLSISSSGQVRPTQSGPSAAARQAREPIAAARVRQGAER